MNRVEVLKKARQSATVIFFLFRREYINAKNSKLDIFAFFEGDDDQSFYMPELRRRWNEENIHQYVCNGKNTVKEVSKKVHKVIDNKNRALFFLDKDLDDILKIRTPKSKNFFITNYYSIENYFPTLKMFKIIWTDIFQLNSNDARLNNFADAFKICKNNFNKLMTPIMGWIAHYREDGKDVFLKEVSMDKVFSFNSNYIISYEKDYLKYLTEKTKIGSDTATSKQLKKMNARLRKKTPKKYIRGKFELWFFVKFVNTVLGVVSKKTAGHKRAKQGLHINLHNAIMLLSAKIQYPKSLGEFLDYNLSRI